MRGNDTKDYVDFVFNTRTQILGLWTILLVLLLFSKKSDRQLSVNQFVSIMDEIIIVIPILLLIANLLLEMPILKWINIIIGIIYIVMNVVNILNKNEVWYNLYIIIQLFITALIIIKSIMWPRIKWVE
jgi:hypothetical protein